MKRLLQTAPFVLSTLIGADSAYTGFHYIVFFSGGSGFIGAVPTAVTILFLGGMVLLFTGAFAFWFPRFCAALAIGSLLVFVGSLVEQTLTHPQPLTVLPKRSVYAVFFLIVAGALYFLHLRRADTAKA